MVAPSDICQDHAGAATPGNPCHLSAAGEAQPFGDWAYLVNHRPPQSVKDLIQKRPACILSPSANWYHRIELGFGNINLDYYEVYITDLPTVNGKKVSASDLFAHIRTNFDTFIATTTMAFGLLDDPGVDHDRWFSDDPLGTVAHFKDTSGAGAAAPGLNPFAENMAVVCTEFVADD